MDELEKRLRADAAAINAEVSDDLQMRIDASLHAAKAMRQERVPRAAGNSGSRWLLSSLTGVAMALAVLVYLNREPATPAAEPDLVADTPRAEVVEQPLLQMLPLKIEEAHLTDSLEQELANLQADFERARESVEEDVRKSF